MAKPVKVPKGKEFEFISGRQKGESRYNWDTWLNGELWLLEQSTGEKDDKGDVIEISEGGKKDFEVNVNVMIAKTKTAARQRYMMVDVSRYDYDKKRLVDSFIVRSRPMTDEERDAEDARREEVKAKLKEKRAEKAESNGHVGQPTASVGF